MKHVYLLESLRFPHRRYKGLTNDVSSRLKRHNDGEVRQLGPTGPGVSSFPYGSRTMPGPPPSNST